MTIHAGAGASDSPRRTASNALFRLGLALVAFGFVTVLALLPISHRWDMPVTRWLQGAPSLFHLPASVLAVLGEAWLTIPVVAIVAGLLFLRQQRAAADAAWLVVWLVVGSIVELALKAVIVHPGPSGLFHPIYLPFGISVGAPYTFPSGHTLRATMIACVGLRRFPWLAAALIASMMAVLIYLGYHWLSEVLGGLCLGWVLIEVGSAIRTRC